jgi:hypothetical protein
MDFSFSNTCGRRLCKINGGKYNKKMIYLYDPKYLCCSKCSKKCKGSCCDNCSMLNYHTEPMDEAVDYLKIDDNGVFQQMPTNNPKQRDAIMIVGKAGAGKSVYLANYCKEYKRLNPTQKIFLFSMKKEDEALDDTIDKRVNLDDYIEKGGLTEANFSPNCFVVFDDVDVLPNDKPDLLRSKIFTLMNSLIQISRSKNITIAQTSHITTNHGETKHILNGMTSFTFFPHAISSQIKRALETYLGLSKPQIKRILALENTRYITVFLTAPTVIMTEKELFILKE